ncbi:hypothetical protein [Azospirillum halopraeferens]|uniref:hypothetical protein n=1 Tax=Azospirillum halopraeferens TaxID=34010 RepID=UPI0003F87A11|nr:hypothetical protein [Azospirillum halopraeferens]
MERRIELRIPDGRMAFGEVPEHVDTLLQEAVAARHDRARCEALLWDAHRAGPRVLPVFFALYKFYFNGARYADAGRVARIGLDAAAALGGWPADWRLLRPGDADWPAAGAPRFTLFTLKALTFISLKQGSFADVPALLAKLAEIDPADHVGWGVVAGLARDAMGE